MENAIQSDEIQEQVACMVLTRLRKLTCAQAHAAIAHYGSAAAVLADRGAADSRWHAAFADSQALEVARERALREMEYCEQNRIRVIPVTSDAYPSRVRESGMTDAPLQLFYMGTTDLNRAHMLSVVGTRHITEYGKQMCQNLIADLARKVPDLIVVSGLAYGVDVHAHRAALSNQLDTIGVLAHGLDRIYPSMHRATASQMVQQGGLLTEYASGVIPEKGNFVRRNRIVAAICEGLLVVESATKGGALITARLARGFGRKLLAVPGRVIDPYSQGCNRLIVEADAVLTCSADDVVRAMGWGAPTEADAAPVELSFYPTTTPAQDHLLSCFTPNELLTPDALSTKSGLPLLEVTSLLYDLVDMGLVAFVQGSRYRLA